MFKNKCDYVIVYNYNVVLYRTQDVKEETKSPPSPALDLIIHFQFSFVHTLTYF